MSMILELWRTTNFDSSGSLHAFRSKKIFRRSFAIFEFCPLAKRKNKPLPAPLFFFTRENPNYPNRIAGLTPSYSARHPPPSPEKNSGTIPKRSLAGRKADCPREKTLFPVENTGPVKQKKTSLSQPGTQRDAAGWKRAR